MSIHIFLKQINICYKHSLCLYDCCQLPNRLVVQRSLYCSRPYSTLRRNVRLYLLLYPLIRIIDKMLQRWRSKSFYSLPQGLYVFLKAVMSFFLIAHLQVHRLSNQKRVVRTYVLSTRNSTTLIPKQLRKRTHPFSNIKSVRSINETTGLVWVKCFTDHYWNALRNLALNCFIIFQFPYL